MPGQVFRFYQRHKLLNINVNILASGVLALAIAKWPVEFATARMPAQHHFLKSLVMALIDGTADVVIYYALHWVANHWRPFKPRHEADQPDEHRSFWRNATLVQFERYALSPVYYAVAMGLAYTLMKLGALSDGWAFVTGFGAAILVTRTLHTLWMLKRKRHLKTGPARVGANTR